MLKKLLDSKLKKRLLRVLFSFPDRAFYTTELLGLAGGSTRTVNSALREFVQADAVRMNSKKRKKYYQINSHFPFYEELENLTGEQKMSREDDVRRELKKISEAKLVLLSGIFTFQPHLEADLLIVGGEGISGKKLQEVLERLEKLAGQEINYAMMGVNEFRHRKSMSDRFIRDVLDYPHIIAINNLRNKNVLI